MHILLTDILACPRCGPEAGLILLADQLEDRRIIEGSLGCANCREVYAVSQGVADLRTNSSRDVDTGARGRDEDAAVRLAALLGLADVQGAVLVVGGGAELAGGMAALVPDVEVVALAGEPEIAPRGAVSRLLGGAALPFRDGVLRGVALTAGADAALLREGLRVLAPGHRLVVDPASADAAETLRALGARTLLDQDGVVVAVAPGRPVQLTRNALR